MRLYGLLTAINLVQDINNYFTPTQKPSHLIYDNNLVCAAKYTPYLKRKHDFPYIVHIRGHGLPSYISASSIEINNK